MIVSSVVKMRSPSVRSCVSGYVSFNCLSTRSTKNGALREPFGNREVVSGAAIAASYCSGVISFCSRIRLRTRSRRGLARSGYFSGFSTFGE